MQNFDASLIYITFLFFLDEDYHCVAGLLLYDLCQSELSQQKRSEEMPCEM